MTPLILFWIKLKSPKVRPKCVSCACREVDMRGRRMQDTWQRMVMLCRTALGVKSPEEAEEKGHVVKNVRHAVVSRGQRRRRMVRRYSACSQASGRVTKRAQVHRIVPGSSPTNNLRGCPPTVTLGCMLPNKTEMC